MTTKPVSPLSLTPRLFGALVAAVQFPFTQGDPDDISQPDLMFDLERGHELEKAGMIVESKNVDMQADMVWFAVQPAVDAYVRRIKNTCFYSSNMKATMDVPRHPGRPGQRFNLYQAVIEDRMVYGAHVHRSTRWCLALDQDTLIQQITFSVFWLVANSAAGMDMDVFKPIKQYIHTVTRSVFINLGTGE